MDKVPIYQKDRTIFYPFFNYSESFYERRIYTTHVKERGKIDDRERSEVFLL